MKDYYVYILTNRSGTLYTGVTNDLMRRVQEHRDGKPGSFTQRYAINRLVYFEHGNDVEGAILREKQLKGWTRKPKIALISEANPRWKDLSKDWYDEEPGASGVQGQILHSVQNDKVGASSVELAPASVTLAAEDQILRSAHHDKVGSSSAGVDSASVASAAEKQILHSIENDKGDSSSQESVLLDKETTHV